MEANTDVIHNQRQKNSQVASDCYITRPFAYTVYITLLIEQTCMFMHMCRVYRVLENLESPGTLLWHFPGLSSPGRKVLEKSHWSWKVLEIC